MLIVLHALYAKTQKNVKREQDNIMCIYVKINNIIHTLKSCLWNAAARHANYVFSGNVNLTNADATI